MHSEKIGRWLTDDCGLPYFEYTGELPYRAVLPNGDDVRLPEDPWFLLGNYRFTLFAHVSGEYELISGQRVGENKPGNQKEQRCEFLKADYFRD